MEEQTEDNIIYIQDWLRRKEIRQLNKRRSKDLKIAEALKKYGNMSGISRKKNQDKENV